MALNEPIAIIGSGCRFPGNASSPSKLWELLSRPHDVLSEIPPERFNAKGFYHADAEYHGHSNVRHSYILSEDHRFFDADFFNIPASEAEAVDPQQRMLLECVYEALEAGALPISNLKGSDTAVYVGLMGEEYSQILLRDLNSIPTYFPTGTARSVVSNRISYFFDWHGPSMTIDTACSSSLVAVHQAVQTLRSGVSRVAIAAGTNLILGPEPYIVESTFHMLSPDGRSKMWDVKADGYGRGDGVAAVVLKRLSDAIADGDIIESVIRETGVNQDGRTRGITVPSASAQTNLIKDTYRRAGLDLSTPQGRPQFFEAHGTGTKIGDPTEAEAIHQAIGRWIDPEISSEKLFVGSIKSIIGHTEGTAGVAGLIKVSLALQHGVISPNLLFETLNPALEPFYQNLEVPTKPIEWPEVPLGQPRRASLNSFGFGGTNAHAIIESYDPHLDQPDEKPKPQPCLIPFVFSATSKSSLRKNLESLVNFLDKNRSTSISDLAYTLSVRRSIFSFRASYSGAVSSEGLLQQIQTSLAESDWESTNVARTPTLSAQILGVFTGQGAQWAGMGKELIQRFPFVQTRLAQLEAVLSGLPDTDRPSWSLQAEILADRSYSKLSIATVSQPVCTAVQILLVDILLAAGVEFTAVVGHSSGEIAAAYSCGIISARDAILIAFYRGLHSNLSGGTSGQAGAMMAVGTSLHSAEEMCASPQYKGRICVAAFNSPTSITLSGDVDAINEAKKVFDAEGTFARLLRVDKAYHSHHMVPCVNAYIQSLRRASIKVCRPREGVRWISSVYSGQVMSGEDHEGLDAVYWSHNMTRTVLFSRAVEAVVADKQFNISIAMEVGPHSALRGPVEDSIRASSISLPLYGSCLLRNRDSIETFSNVLGLVWKSSPGGAINFEHLINVVCDQTSPTPKLVKHLPTYQWNHDRIYWYESRRSKTIRTRPQSGHPLLGNKTPDSTDLDMVWQNVINLSELPWLQGHQLQGQTIFPAAGYVALALEAGMLFADKKNVSLIELEDLSIKKVIVLEEEKSGVEILFSLHVEQNTDDKNEKTAVASFRLHSSTRDSGSTILNATGRIRLVLGNNPSLGSIPQFPTQDPSPPNMVDVGESQFYSSLRQIGYQYSGSFRALDSMRRKFGHGRGIVNKLLKTQMHKSERILLIQPGFLDAAFQAIFLAYSYPGDGRLWSLHVPNSINRIRVNPTLCRATLNQRFPFDSTITDDSSITGDIRICGDIEIYTGATQEGMIQIEGLQVVPFAPATSASDTQMFFDNVLGVASPDCDLVMIDDRASAADIDLGWALERISFFYLRSLTLEITPEEEETSPWHCQRLLAFARHVVDKVANGEQPYGKKEWMDDGSNDIKGLEDSYIDAVEDIRLMRSVGHNLTAAVRGTTTILDHMMQDEMLSRYYTHSLGLKEYTGFLAEVISQIAHRYPQMRILEVGAGTGAATKSILRNIKYSFDEYTFTDISVGFFEKAQLALSEYADRMVFRALDAEKDVIAQGFEEGAYDLVVASLVLHATKDLREVLANLRRLLKPGGYLVMLEITSNDQIRFSFTMGGLPQWWIGADSGRPWSPCISTAEWNVHLSSCGFSGIETSTPELDPLPRPFSILVSRAIDNRISSLLEPSSDVSDFSRISNLVILKGTTIETHQMADAMVQLLKIHCSRITVVDTLQKLQKVVMSSSQIVVVSLIELEHPVFKDLNSEAFDALKYLFTRSQSIVWATRGCMQDEPYANMMVGFGRALMMEMPDLRIRFIDFDTESSPSPQLIVGEVLRLQIESGLEIENGCAGGLDTILWSCERELIVNACGNVFVRRVRQNKVWNNNYNSSRRKISSEIKPSEQKVVLKHIHSNPDSFQLSAPKVNSHRAAAQVLDETIRIRVFYVTLSAIPFSSTTALYLCIGLECDSHLPVITGLETISSIAQVRKHDTTPYHGRLDASAADFLYALASHILSSFICSRAKRRTNLLLIEPDLGFAEVCKHYASRSSIGVTSITSSPNGGASEFVSISPLASKRTIKQRIPSDVSMVITFREEQAKSQRYTEVLRTCVPRSTEFVNATTFEPNVEHCDDAPFPIGDSLKNALRLISEAFGSDPASTKCPLMIPANELSEYTRIEWPTVVDWTAAQTLPILIEPSDSTLLLQGDRTYLLIGLAGKGGLGLSLADWMIRQGAKNIILTSRSPKADPKWLESHAARGARVELVANDATNFQALQALVEKVQRSWPPIAGVAHGAMVLHDAVIDRMSYNQMMQVLRPKVDGARFLDQIFHDDPLDFFVLLSSVSCVTGYRGQSNYAAANMYLTSLAAQRRKRGVAASVMDLGTIMGIGYIAREVSEQNVAQLARHGYRQMSEHDLQITFANAILAGQIGSEFPEELVTGFYLPTLEDNIVPIWYENPTFSHLTRRKSSKSPHKMESFSPTASPKELLEIATSQDQVAQIVQDTILAKFKTILQLGSEVTSNPHFLLEKATDDIGIDSLVAVEIRTWLMRELGVNMPLLKIFGGSKIAEIVDYAVLEVPRELLPRIRLQNHVALSDTLESPPVNFSDEPLSSPATPLPSLASPSLNNHSTVSSTPLSQTSPLKLMFPDHTIERIVPMSFGQSRFWFMSQFVEDPTTFNVTISFNLTGEIDTDFLSKLVHEVGHRHEALRTCFFIDENHQSVQGILSRSLLFLETTNVSSEAEAQNEFHSLKNHIYDLASGESMRIILMSRSKTQHQLLVGYHHINMDSTSLGVLISEMRQLYAGGTLPPKLLQYPEFCQLQRQNLSNDTWARELSFWRQEFQVTPDPLPFLRVSSERSHQNLAMTTYRNLKAEKRISAEVSSKVQLICRKLKVTPFHLHFTIFRILLTRLAGTEDICIGIADANRDFEGAGSSIGNFLNLLPVLLCKSLSQTFASILKDTRQKIISALSNSVVPFDVIIENVGAARSPSHSPLFQAFVDYRRVVETQPFANGILDGNEYELGQTPYDVMLDIIDNDEGTALLSIMVQKGKYTKENAQTILDCYFNLMNAFIADCELKATEPQMWDSNSVERALEMGQGEQVEFDNKTILDDIDEIAAKQPTFIALKDGNGSRLSYQEMISKSLSIARSIEELNIKPHSKIAVMQEPTVDWICSMLGIWRAGCTYVPLEISQGSQRLKTIIREAGLVAVLVHDESVNILSEVGWAADKSINVSHLLTGLYLKDLNDRLPTPGDEAMILYTSGSTGSPKGISIPHRMIVNSIRGFLHHWKLDPQIILQQIALSFDVSWWQALVGLATNGTVVIAVQSDRKDPIALTKLIASERITMTLAVPSEAITWLKYGDPSLLRSSDWVWHLSAGEDFSFNLVKQLQALAKQDLRALNVYGPAETIIPNICEVPYQELSSSDTAIPVGKVMPNYSVYIVDDDGHPVPAGVAGQLVIAGAGVANGYINNPVLTAERFPEDILAKQRAIAKGWTVAHRSGDYGYLRASDGVFVVQGRTEGDTQVKLRGQRLDVREVESAIIGTAGDEVVEAVVHLHKGGEEDGSSDFLVAHVVLSPPALTRIEGANDQYLMELASKLPVAPYMRPSVIIPLTSLPLSHHGKINRKAIAKLSLEGNQTVVADEVSLPTDGAVTESQKQMKEIWLSVFHNSVDHDIHLASDFFLLGGNSLQLISIQHEVKSRFDKTVPLAQLFDASTLGQMAELINTTDTIMSKITVIKTDWSRETQIDLNLRKYTPTPRKNSRDGLVIILTDAIGLLGHGILLELMAMTNITTIHCIAIQNTERLANLSSKIVIHTGYLTDPNLGLSETDSRNIFSSADIIIHNAAEVSFLKSYSSLKLANLGSTKTLVRFALQHGSVSHFHFVSTARVATIASRDLYEESVSSLSPERAIDGYVTSKWACEKYLENVNKELGLPLTIHRPSSIIGIDPNGMLYNIMSFAERLQAAPRLSALEGWFQFVEMEDVAKGITLNILDSFHERSGVQYKNYSGNPNEAVDVHGIASYLGAKEAGITFESLDDEEWIERASAAGLPGDMAGYLRNLTGFQKGGKKIVFPKVWRGVK